MSPQPECQPTMAHVSVGQSQNCFYSLVDTKDEGRLGRLGAGVSYEHEL